MGITRPEATAAIGARGVIVRAPRPPVTTKPQPRRRPQVIARRARFGVEAGLCVRAGLVPVGASAGSVGRTPDRGRIVGMPWLAWVCLRLAGPRTYLRTAERSGRRCGKAVFGSRLKAAVANGCSQALRASYLSVNGKRMGTIGVLNLATSTAAARVGKVVTAPRQFVQPLQAAHGATRDLGHGTGVVWAVAKGHYLILMWAQYASLRSPATSHDRKVLMQFINDLYQKSVNQSLTRRMVTGSPLTP